MGPDVLKLIGKGSVTLWEHPNCTGHSLFVSENHSDLGPWNDLAESVLVPK